MLVKLIFFIAKPRTRKQKAHAASATAARMKALQESGIDLTDETPESMRKMADLLELHRQDLRRKVGRHH